MKRPLMIIGFSLFVSLAVFSYFHTAALISILITFTIISLALLILLRKSDLKNASLLFVGVALAALLLLCIEYFCSKPLEKYDGTSIEAEGYVTRVDDKSYVLKCKIDGKYCNIYIADYDTETINCGDRYYINTQIFHVDSVEDSYIRTKSKAHNCFLYSEDVILYRTYGITTEYPFEDYIFRLKNYLLEIQKEEFSEFSCGFVNAVTLGDRRFISSEINNSFKRAGLSHVLVISGMHLSIISGIVFTMLRSFGKRKAALISVFATLFYMALTGFEPSITRAGIMNIIMYFATVFREDYDNLSSLGIACLVMCCINPYCSADISLQLSVASTVGILVFLPPARKFIWSVLRVSNKLTRAVMRLSDMFLVSISANLALMPFYIFVFGTVSIVSPVSNIVSSILMPFIIANSLLATLIGILPIVSGAACVPAFLADVSIFGLVKSTEWFSNFKYASVGTEYTFMAIWVIATAILFVFAFLKRKGKLKLHALILSIILLFASIFCYNINNSSKVSVKISPTATNGCVILTYKGHNAVICGINVNDNIYNIKYSLLDAGVNDIDLLLVPEYDDSVGIIDIIREYNVEKLIVAENEIDPTVLRKISEVNVDFSLLPSGCEIDFGDEIRIDVHTSESGKNVLFEVDGVVFNMNFGEFNLLDDYDTYKELDIAIIGTAVPYGLEYMDLSYIVFGNSYTEKNMYKNTLYLAERFAFSKDSITFMIEDGEFYTVKEWGSRI